MNQGNTPAIIKAMQSEIVGTEKTMIYTLGYGNISIFRNAPK